MMDYDDYTYENVDFRNVLSEMKVLNSEFFVINDLLDEGQLVEAINRLDSIPFLIPLGKEEKYEYTQFVEWVYWRIEIINSGRDLENLTSNDLNELESIADEFDSFASSLAISVLNDKKRTPIFTPPALGKSSINYKSIKQTGHVFDSSNSPFSIYPNPANAFVTIDLKNLANKEDVVTIVLRNMLGQIVQEFQANCATGIILLNTSQLSSRAYSLNIMLPSHLELNSILNVAH